MKDRDPAKFQPRLLATGVGSLPHRDPSSACALIGRTLPETPYWPQLPRFSPLEAMDLQVSPGLPFLNVDAEKGEISFDPTRPQAEELEKVYGAYLSGEIDPYRLPFGYAGGFESMVAFLEERRPPLRFFKGQMIGPITFGLAVKDEQGRDLIHNETVFDGLAKALLLRGRWIIGRMKAVCPEVIFFLDEPALSGFGSAFFSVEAAAISSRLNEFIEEFQNAGARVGIHCCGNTDWSLLLSTPADIVNFDAYGYFDRLALYPAALKDFLARGGILAWGIVPTLRTHPRERTEDLMERLEAGLAELARHVPEMELREQSLLTPSCGLGLLPLPEAEWAMETLGELSRRMRRKYFGT